MEGRIVETVSTEIRELFVRVHNVALTDKLAKEIEELSERIVQMVAAECSGVIEAAESAIDYLLHGRANKGEEILLTDALRAKEAMNVLEDALSKFGSRKERKAKKRSLTDELNCMIRSDNKKFSRTRYFS
jgi:hypothetical protein